MAVPLVDLKAQTQALKEEIRENVLAVLESTQYINGPSVSAFEEQLAAYTGAAYGVGCASGTDALYLALRACGIGPGDEVITTPFTFVATAEAICRCGARPIFADIDPITYNLDPAAVARAVTSRTRAILPVHLFGHAADMDPLLQIARAKGLKLIEDNAQALGGTYKGCPLGGIGDVGCFSFYPSKTLGAAGDAGAIVTNHSDIAEKVRRLRDHGSSRSYYHEEHGLNSRLDTIQAAILSVKLRHMDRFVEQRNRVAAWYDEALEGLPVKRPVVMEGCGHAFGYYTIEVDNRATVQAALNARRIGNAVYYPLSLHLQPVFAYLGYGLGDFPKSEYAQGNVLSLPMYPELARAQVEEVVGALKDAVGQKVR
ncbi:MAG: DegT/DnrJ/EryC1/StrS family aminotransferase [Dehalococcoidia bacterium]|nr:DegT/DnrJ/EryC1/StrS family aminotransferase [Dehalococcoidia bacterium]